MKKLRIFFALVTCHPLAWLGTASVTFGTIFTFGYLIAHAFQKQENPYSGILFMAVAVPSFFGGLGMIPVGIWLQVRKLRKLDHLSAAETFMTLGRRIGNTGDLRAAGSIFFALTGLNVLITAAIVVHGYEYTESNQFCGMVCHTVMEPEYTAYQRSPHARVHCVDCHIGSGATWFVKSKLSGLRQVVGVMRGVYSRPIEVPIHNLRPSRDTCETCHWPDKFHGEKLKVFTHFQPDRDNTKLYSVLMLKVGGSQAVPGNIQGVHWHVGKDVRVTYVSDKNKREDIPWVRLEKKGQPPVEYRFTGTTMTDEDIEKAEKREMECIDCHNRPTHVYEMPEDAADSMLGQFKELQTLPWIKKATMEILNRKFTEKEIVDRKVEAALLNWYAVNATEEKLQPELLRQAAQEVQSIYRRNVWPRMNIDWGTYPHHISHIHSPGCLRCHDNTHRSPEGRTINADCRLCHVILAIKEKDPEILKVLR